MEIVEVGTAGGYTRFYRVRQGRRPVGGTGLVAGDLGWVKIAVFPGDGDTFSITVGAPVGNAGLKELVDPHRFERFVGAFPQIAPWRERGVSVPIAGKDTPVLVMGQLRNRRRRFVDARGAARPRAVRPRRCGLPLEPDLRPRLLDGAAPGDPARRGAEQAPRRSDRGCTPPPRAERDHIGPFWDAAVASDRRARGVDRVATPTSTLSYLAVAAEQAFGWFLERGMLPATRVDPVVFRGLLRVAHMLEPPRALVRDPELVLRSLPMLARVLAGRGPSLPFEPVPRDTALARMAS